MHSDFESAFDEWHGAVEHEIGKMDFNNYEAIKKIAGIIVGDEITLDACLPLVGQWYRLLIAKCFFICPTNGTTKGFFVVIYNLSNNSNNWFTDTLGI